MNIPENVIDVFKKEAESIKYGKVYLGFIRRGNHEHYEIDKHITMKDNDDMTYLSQEEKYSSLKMDADEGSKDVFNGNNDDSKL
jgi:hypothetical protein